MMVKDSGSPMCFLPLTNLGRAPLDRPQQGSSIDLPCELGRSVFKTDIHVVNWVNLVVVTLSPVSNWGRKKRKSVTLTLTKNSLVQGFASVPSLSSENLWASCLNFS